MLEGRVDEYPKKNYAEAESTTYTGSSKPLITNPRSYKQLEWVQGVIVTEGQPQQQPTPREMPR